MSVLFATERYAVMLAVLYIDQWLACEYIVNTNSLTSTLAISLFVHELRDAGVQERLHGELSHTIVLSMLVASNIMVLVFGENQSVVHLLAALFPASTTQPASVSAINSKKTERSRPTHCPNPSPFYSGGGGGGGALVYMLVTCVLLGMLSTCAMPVSTHDPVLNNLRIWSFTTLSLIWFYTIDYKQLRYSSVTPFTPCVLRFSCILFLTPTPFAIGGVLLMATCLAATYSWNQRHLHEPHISTQYAAETPPLQPGPHNRLTGVVREPSPGCVISYRSPTVLSEKTDSLKNVASVKAVASSGNVGGAGMESVIDMRDGGDSDDSDTKGVEGMTPGSDIDYNSLFEQVLSQHAV
jgi:hypothetical protein